MTHRILALLLAAILLAGAPRAGVAFSDEPYLGAVELVGYRYCPVGSLVAAGQWLTAKDYAGLFALIGMRYGGDSATGTFALPDLRDQAPAGMLYCIVIEGAFPAQP
jgi:microcystin-dependent protein